MAVVWKDLALEARSKDVGLAMPAFVLMVVFLFAFALTGNQQDLRPLFPGILWMSFLFAGMLGIGRSFYHEVPEDALLGLILAPGGRTPIFLAKVAVALLFMLGTEVVASPVFFALFGVPWTGHWGLFGLVLGLGALGFAGVGVLLGAIAANIRSGDVLVPLALAPLEVPVIITAVQATAAILATPMGQPWPWIHGLMAYDAIFLALPLVVYEFLWEV